MKHMYFELDEFIRSDTAKKYGIDNTPTFAIVAHLDELVESILDPLRAAYGKPITVTSGYRCNSLNKAVGGADTSAHKIGYAADVVAENFTEFRQFAVSWFQATKPKFDQLLLEKDSSGKEWIHIGLYNRNGQQRGQIMILNV